MVHGWKKALKALVLLLVSCALVVGFARAIAQPFWFPLYENQFTFTPGDWFTRKLNNAREMPPNTCLLLGASTVREGFDTALLESHLSGRRVVNMATTGGHSTIDVVEIQARVLSKMGDRYDCIVVGMHPMFLRKFTDDSFEIIRTDYAAILPFHILFDLTRSPFMVDSAGQILFKYAMPFAQHSLIMQRILRSALFSLHRRVFDDAVPLKLFEQFPDELKVQGQYTYSEPSVLNAIRDTYPEQIRQMGWDDPASYGSPQEAKSLNDSLKLLSGLTKHLIIIDMPESFLFNNVDKVARKPFEDALRSVSVPIDVVRCEIPLSEQTIKFHDAIHMGDYGRMDLSNSVAPYMAAAISNKAMPINSGICRLANMSKNYSGGMDSAVWKLNFPTQ